MFCFLGAIAGAAIVAWIVAYHVGRAQAGKPLQALWDKIDEIERGL